MTIDSIPARCNSRASISPAGPAPIMPTCVRMLVTPERRRAAYRRNVRLGPMDDCRKDLDISLNSGRDAVARHARLVLPVGVAEFGFEVAFLSRDDTKVYEQHGWHQHYQCPVRGKRDA